MKILMVCLGNICRSPLAEGILQTKVGDNHLVDSAGTGDWHVGEQPDRRSVAVAKNMVLIFLINVRCISIQFFSMSLI